MDDVELSRVEARGTAVVPATTTWAEFPGLWGVLLGEVWDCLRAGGITRGRRNVMLYRDDVPHVEVGVLLDRALPPSGRVVRSELPGGLVATALHHGSFADLGRTHERIVRWCAAQGHRTTGLRWEVYGPHDDDPARQWVEIAWQLAPDEVAGR